MGFKDEREGSRDRRLDTALRLTKKGLVNLPSLINSTPLYIAICLVLGPIFDRVVITIIRKLISINLLYLYYF